MKVRNKIKIIDKEEGEMKQRIYEVLVIILFLTSIAGAQQSWNVDLIGRWPNGPCYAVFIAGNYAYIGNGGAMDILDISNPSSPALVGQIVLPSVVQGIYVNGGYAYVADDDYGLRIIDVSNPTIPQEVGYYDTPIVAQGVYVNCGYAYVADRYSGMRIIDFSNPSSPQEVGYYDTGDWAEGVYVNGGYTYLADEKDGLYIFHEFKNSLTFSPTPLNLGSVIIGSKQQKSITVTNNDSVAITISNTYITGSFASEFSLISGGAPFTLAPSQNRDMVVEFSPQSVGNKQAYLILESDAPSSPDTVFLFGTGILPGQLSFSPTVLNYDSLQTGTSLQKTVTITNIGGVNVNVSNSYLTGSNASEFSLVSGGAPFTLKPSQSRDMVVEFSPQSAGNKQAYLILESDAPSSPDMVTLQGTGILAELNLSQNFDNFGNVPVDSSAVEQVNVTNSGNIPLIISQSQLTGPNTSEFSILNSDTFTVNPGQTHGMTLQFTPATAGEKDAFLVLESNSPTSPDTISLHGMGMSLGNIIVPTPPQVGAPAEIGITIPAGVSVADALLYYRPPGALNWSSVNLSGSDTLYRASIPAAAISERGVEYYFSISDGQNIFTYPPTDPRQHPIFLPVRVPQMAAKVELSPRTYKMVSIPLQMEEPSLAGLFRDDYADHDSTRWRLFRWNGATGNYHEYHNGLLPSLPVYPGMAFWLITNDGHLFDVDSAVSVDASQDYQLQLTPGWNQIGNPFAFPVAWDSIGGSEQVQALVWWNGNEYEYNQSTLQPWEGYFVYNPGGQTVTLQVRPRESQGNLKKSALFASASDGECLLQLSAVGQLSRQADRQNYLGLLKSAGDGLDARDFLAAPPIEQTLALDIVDGEHLYAGNFRSAGKEGAFWDLTLSSPRKEAVTLTVSELSGLPDGFQYWLMDLDRRCLLPQSNGTASVQISEAGEARHLRLILGTAEFAKNSSEGIPLVPLQFALQQNYPNPFNPETRITYQLPERSEERLEIYNTLGQKVRTLVRGMQDTGIHTVVWDGRDESGQPAASGVYLYMLQAGKYRQTRKMILMK
ncbi:MAG: hypothetical protein Kow0037_28440 [Calditrichia bacterium]